jgi:hypothetical protein
MIRCVIVNILISSCIAKSTIVRVVSCKMGCDIFLSNGVVVQFEKKRYCTVIKETYIPQRTYFSSTLRSYFNFSITSEFNNVVRNREISLKFCRIYSINIQLIL